ncbi:death domain-containing protein 1-like [Saccostrea echinata]|uniref:death domain-containing protein 1-like n=1 Tax=Saccostrea echinata TaxID=191078 RepID=UPI002A7F3C92|nr:death domain-containing protein 1-like [Saccostrea echinata]XP_061190144.1 death domain-containing protein 1-like [Saccostrea echinata]
MPVERRQVAHGGHGRHDHGGGHGSTKTTKRPSSSSKSRTTVIPKDKEKESIATVKSVNEAAEESGETENVTTEEVPNGVKTEDEKAESEDNIDDTKNGEESESVNDEPDVQEKDDQDRWAEKSKDDEGFNIRSFNDNILEFTEIFDSDRYRNVDSNYPVEDLMGVVSQISNTIEEFKQQTQNSQQQLEGLRMKMKQVKENIQFSVSRKAFEIRTDDDLQSVEERELTEKLAKLNAEIAKANSDLSEALRLSAETESTAVRAQIAAERAKEEAKRIEEEVELRAQLEERRKREEAKKMEELRRQQEAEARRQEEEKRAKEAEWKKRENAGIEKSAVWETWPAHEMQLPGDGGLACIIRGKPNSFDQSSVTCKEVDQLEIHLTYGPQEELVGSIIQLVPISEQTKLQSSLYVAIPFTLSRASVHSREAFVKADINGEWKEIPSTEVTYDNHKDLKFVQVEIKEFFTMAVMTRLKRDYVTFSRRPSKMTSSCDHRITVTVARETFSKKEHILLQVQPVDSATVNDLQTRNVSCKHLLASSPIVQMQWESNEFHKPIVITLPCPPNPAKARKIAQMRKIKEEKMKNPQKNIPVPLDVREKEENQGKQKKAKPKKKTLQEQLAEINAPPEEEKPKPTKWYMGDYAHNDDDEHDQLCLLARTGTGKWFVVPEVEIAQVKLDLLQFCLDKPLEQFMVLRVRTNTDEDLLPVMSTAIFDLLQKRFVQVVIKQRSDNPFDTRLTIVPASRVQKIVKQMTDDGYEDGPEPSPVVGVSEGDLIEINFRGNIQNGSKSPNFIYNSNVVSFSEFLLSEVDQYLQRNFNVFRGVVEAYRVQFVTPDKRTIARKESIMDENSFCVRKEKRKTLLCEIPITIPKYHVEPSPVPVQAPVVIRNDSDAVNDNLMRQLAAEMGDEWRKVASTLNISKARIQAIIRNAQITDATDEDARFQMLMTWLKKMPKSIDKVTVLTNAFMKNGRPDLAEQVRIKDEEFKRKHIRSH